MTDQKEMLCIGDAPGYSEVIFEPLGKALIHVSIPAPCPSSTAGPALSSTVELLEQVLHYCTAMDLVRWQSVSPQWHVVINSTKSLQQKLFRTLPDGPMLILGWTAKPLSWRQENQEPTIIEDNTGAKIATEGTGNAPLPAAIVRLHPWLSHVGKNGLCFALDPRALLSLRSGLGHDMFVTMPPSATVKLRYSAATAGKKKAATVERYVYSAAGVTLGDLSRQLECDIQRQEAVEVNGFASRNEKKFAEFVQRLGQRAERISRMTAELEDNPELFTIRGEAKACVFKDDMWVVQGYRNVVKVASCETKDSSVR
ncbi:hypothetical protein LTR17_022623 [Elasticomyces elasticus]|nr:hypothetical protein LTR17_022623 [Elasticomyces elasticus]